MYILYIFRCSCAAFGRNKLMMMMIDDDDDDDDDDDYVLRPLRRHPCPLRVEIMESRVASSYSDVSEGSQKLARIG